MNQNSYFSFLCTRRGSYLLLALLFGFTSGIRLFTNDVENLGDIHIYIAMAQSLHNGSVLYKEAIDIKNMGFLFFFYGLYKPYALIFPYMNYFTVYMNTFLMFFYYGLSLMMYEILKRAHKPLPALFGASLFLLYFSTTGNRLNLNQPQYSLFTLLLLTLFLSFKKEYRLKDYLIIGVLLGLNAAGNSPFILLTLIVPFLIWQKGMNFKIYAGALWLKGGIAFAGFLLCLAPYYWYFHTHDALGDWWTWQVVYPSIYSPKSWSMIMNWLPIFCGNGGTTMTRILATAPLFLTAFYALSFRKKIFFSPALALILLAALSRMIFLSRGYSWYALFFLPLVAAVCAARAEYGPRTKRFVFFWFIWALGVFSFPTENSGTIRSYRNSYLRWDYDKKAAYITARNPDKHPEVYVSPRPHGFVYSTKWKYTYYNIYGYPDQTKGGEERDNNLTISLLMPEVCILGSDLRGSRGNLGVPAHYPVLQEKYTQVSPTFYIRNDKVGEWDLAIDPKLYLEFTPIVSLLDLIPLKGVRLRAGEEEGSEDLYEKKARL